MWKNCEIFMFLSYKRWPFLYWKSHLNLRIKRIKDFLYFFCLCKQSFFEPHDDVFVINTGFHHAFFLSRVYQCSSSDNPGTIIFYLVDIKLVNMLHSLPKQKIIAINHRFSLPSKLFVVHFLMQSLKGFRKIAFHKLYHILT